MDDRIQRILIENNIPHILQGKNIGKRAVAGINCPFCRDDVGFHLGILRGKKGYYFTCWKNSKHTGTLPALFSHLLNISLLDAKRLLNEETSIISENFLDNVMKMCYNKGESKAKVTGVDTLDFLPTFRRLDGNYTDMPAAPFYQYLIERGFLHPASIGLLYTLRYSISTSDGWGMRIIVPFFINKKLQSWIGRTIDPLQSLRYKNLKKEESVRHPKLCLFNYDTLASKQREYNNPILYITEGVFDAIKIEAYSSGLEVFATAIMTTSMTEEQIALLYDVAHYYRKIVILLDKGAEAQALSLADTLSFLSNIHVRFLPDSYPDDPGDMTPDQVEHLTNKELNE